MFSHNDGASAPISEVSKIDELLEPGLGENRDTDNPDVLETLDDEIKSIDFAQEKGGVLNQLYAQYLASKDEDTLARLLADVENYARRVTSLEAGKKARFLNQSVKDKHPQTDISQRVMLSVFLNLDKFKNDSKFSTWVYRIVQNAVIDTVRQIDRRNEVDLLEWRANDAPYAGSKSSAEGTSPDGISDPEDETGSDGGGHAAAPILSQKYFNQNQDGITANLDFEKAFRKLSKRDQRMVELFRDGYKPADIGKEFGHDAKWASNQLTRLKELLKHEMYATETILHSCKRSVQPTAVLEEGRLYTDEGDGYCALPTCRCKKRITALEAKTLIKNGEAHPVYRIQDGEPVIVAGEVWAQQSVRVPRVGLNSNRADLERAYVNGNRQGQLDIEIAHEMSQASLKKLITPFREDQWEGRAIFTSFTEQRTKGGFKPYPWTKPEQKPKPADRQTVLVEEKAFCPKCHKHRMAVFLYIDGSVRNECRGGHCYLMVWKPPTSKSAVSNVIVLESNTSLPASQAAD